MPATYITRLNHRFASFLGNTLLPNTRDGARLRIAVVHEWLTSYAGSEKVLEQILLSFPTADIFSLVDFLAAEDRVFLGNKPVKTSFLQKLPFGEKLFRKLLWLLPLAVESFDLSPYDIVVSSSHAVAKGVLTGPDQLHVCYCHSPIRYAWDLQHEYLRQTGVTQGWRGIYARLTLHYMRLWDVRTSNGVDCFVANSLFIARRIQKVYRRGAVVIHPPVDLAGFQLQTVKENYYITVSRLVPYKRVDLIAAAFSRMPNRKLIVIGDGPNLESWRRDATPNVEFLGRQSDEVVREMMGRAKAFVFAAEEDFGISVVEAQSCGTPVICFGRGGALDSVIAGKTGLFFKQQSAESIQEAVEAFERIQESFEPQEIRSHAETFSSERFRREFKALVLDEANKHDLIEKSAEPLRTLADFLGRERTSPRLDDLAALETALSNYQPSRKPAIDHALLDDLVHKD